MNQGRATGDRRKKRPARPAQPRPLALPVRPRRVGRPKVRVGMLLWFGLVLVALGLGIFAALYLPVREARFAALEVRLEEPFLNATLPRFTYVAAPSPSGSVEHVAANGTTVTVPGGLAGQTISVRLYVDDDALDALASQLGATPHSDATGWRVLTLSAKNMSVEAPGGEGLRAATLPPSYRQTSMWGYRQELTFGFAQPPPDDPPVIVDVFPAPQPPWTEPISVAAVLTLNASYDPLGVRTGEPSERRSLPLVLTSEAPSILLVEITPDESSTSWTLVLNGAEQVDFVGPVSEVMARGFDGLFRASGVRRPVASGADEVSMVAEGKPLFASYVDGRLSVTGVTRSARTAFGDELLPTRWDLWPVWAQTFAISAGASAVVGLIGYGVGLWRQAARGSTTPTRRRIIRREPRKPRELRTLRHRRRPPGRGPGTQ